MSLLLKKRALRPQYGSGYRIPSGYVRVTRVVSESSVEIMGRTGEEVQVVSEEVTSSSHMLTRPGCVFGNILVGSYCFVGIAQSDIAKILILKPCSTLGVVVHGMPPFAEGISN